MADTTVTNVAPEPPTIDLSPHISLTASPVTPQVQHVQHVKLSLMQPLAHLSTISSCRLAYYSIETEGEKRPSNNAYLDLTPLTTAWRSAFKQLDLLYSRNTAIHITFDLFIPAPEVRADNEVVPKVDWDINEPAEGGVSVKINEVSRLVMTLATAAKMRAAEVGAEVRFEVVQGYMSRKNVLIDNLKALEKKEKDWVVVERSKELANLDLN